MSRLERFTAKPEKIEIEGDEYDIYPLTMQDIDLFMKLDEDSTRAKALSDIIRKTLKKSVPDSTNEEIDNLSFKYFESLSTAIIKVNTLENSDSRKILIEEIKEKQKQKQ